MGNWFYVKLCFPITAPQLLCRGKGGGGEGWLGGGGQGWLGAGGGGWGGGSSH